MLLEHLTEVVIIRIAAVHSNFLESFRGLFHHPQRLPHPKLGNKPGQGGVIVLREKIADIVFTQIELVAQLSESMLLAEIILYISDHF